MGYRGSKYSTRPHRRSEMYAGIWDKPPAGNLTVIGTRQTSSVLKCPGCGESKPMFFLISDGRYRCPECTHKILPQVPG